MGRNALSLFLMGGLWPGRGTCLYGVGMVLGSVCERYGTWAAHGGLRARGLSYQVSVGFMGIGGRGGVYHGRFHPSLEGGFFEGEKVSRCGRGFA
jgi:hypothetical protein